MSDYLTSPDGHIVGFMDIGTNSVRMLVVRINPNRSYTVLTQLKEKVRLGEDEFGDSPDAVAVLQPAAIERAVQACTMFANTARSQGADQIITVATSATREAKNQDDFVRRLEAEAGLDVRAVSGKEEARLIFLGVSSGIHMAGEQALFIDIGGGSTEVSIGTQHEYLELDSLKMGAIRLTRFFLPGHTDPVSREQYEQIRQYVRDKAVPTIRRMRSRRIDFAVGSSGTIEKLGDIAIRKFFKRKWQEDDVLTLDQLHDVTKMLCSLSLKERKDVSGLSSDRADIIIAGAAILETLMEEMELSELRISERGLRDGLLVDYLARHGYLPETVSIRKRNVIQLGRTCGFDEDHGREAARLALELFDSAGELDLHTFGQWERELLEYAALLHDIGTVLTYNNHHAHTHYMIRNSELLGFDETELSIIAATAYYHRKKRPKKKHEVYGSLDKRSRRIVKKLSALLRIAENLDRSHAGVIRHAHLCPHETKKKRITLAVDAIDNCQAEVWGVQKHTKPFKKAFKRKLDIQVMNRDGN